MLDANVLFRLFKCNAVYALNMGLDLHVAAQVHHEFSKGGPAERSILKDNRLIQHQVIPGTAEWQYFCLIRQKFSTRDLGEDESLAVCLAEAERGNPMPFVTFDSKGSSDALTHGIVTIGFLGLLSWCVELGSLTLKDAEALEQLARIRNGWKRPSHFSGDLDTVAAPLREQTIAAMNDWKKRATANRKKRRR